MLTLSITRTRSDRESTGATESFGMAGFTIKASPEWSDVRVDAASNRVLVAPPLLGRPFYYTVTSGGELYASTHFRFFRQMGIRLEEDPDALPELLVYRIVNPPHTLYRNIKQLPLCYRLEITVGRELRLQEVAAPFPAPQAGIGLAESAERLESALARYLRQLDPARTAVLMSGGIDSTLMWQIFSRQCGGSGIAYSSSYPFESPGLEVERAYATSAATALKIPHSHYVPTHEEYLKGSIEAIAAAEMPVHHLQSVLMHLLCRDGIDASRPDIVNSHGAGLAFGNARSFFYWRRRHPWFRAVQIPPVITLLRFINYHTGRGGSWLQNATKSRLAGNAFSRNPDNPMWSWKVYGDPEWVRTRLGMSWPEIVGRQIEAMRPFQSRDLRDVWAIYGLLGDENVTQIIWYKIGHAQGRNVHYPFYDSEVLDLAFRLPWPEKLGPPRTPCARLWRSEWACPGSLWTVLRRGSASCAETGRCGAAFWSDWFHWRPRPWTRRGSGRCKATFLPRHGCSGTS